MKKAMMLLALLCTAAAGFGCDICGSATNGYNPFLFPHLSKNHIGFTYLHRVYQTFPVDGVAAREYYHSYSLTVQLSLTKKWQVQAMLPYQQNTLVNAYGKKTLTGPGDATILVNYRLLNRQPGEARHAVSVGAGIKLPAGKYTPAKTETISEQNFQLGSGSVDYLLNGMYTLGYRQWMFGASASYKYNTANKDAFRFGDVFTAGASIVYKKEWKQFTLSPYVQLRGEMQMKDASNHYLQDHSGGHAMYVVPGFDMNAGRLSFGASYQFAAEQRLAQEQVQVKPAFSVHISLTI